MPATAPPFPHRLAGHCGSGALRDLLEHRGLDYGDGPLSEGAVFGLAGGLGCYYGEFPELTPPFYLVGRTGDLERDIAPNLGAALDVRATDDPAEGWAWVRDELDAGRPTMVWADIAELEYLRVRMTNTRHDIVIAGYDEAEGIAWVADNDRDELQRCSLASLAAARSSHGFPGPNRHTTFVYDWPAELPPPDVAAARGIRRAIENMRTEPESVGRLPGAMGLAAIDAFTDGYPEWPVRFGDRLGDALRVLRVLIVKAGTGGAMFRTLHAEFLRDFAGLLADDRFAAAADLYDELASAWVALAASAADGDHERGIEHARIIAALEHDGVAAMARLVD